MRSTLPGQTEMQIPSAENADLVRRAIQQKLRPSKPQEPCDIGLFSDDAAQMDLIEMFMD